MEKSHLMSGRSANSMVGLPVYTLENGKRIGSVKDVIYDSEHSIILAFTLEEYGIFSTHRWVLPFMNVKSIGQDAVMAENENAFVKEKDAPNIAQILKHRDGIANKSVITESGSDLGNVTDVLVNESTGRAVSYEVTGGFAKDIGSGRSYVAALDAKVVGKQALILPDEVETMLQTQTPGGLVGAYESAKAQGRDYGESVNAYTQQKEIDLSHGKTAGRDIYDDQEKLIVARDQEITDDVINEAVSKDKMHDVAMAAGVAGLAAGYGRLQAGVTEATQERLKGKRVPYDITNDQGDVVVQGGTIITDQTLKRTGEAGMMYKLATSVLGSATRGGTESVWDETKDWFSRTWSNVTKASEQSADKAGRRRVVSEQKRFLVGKISINDVHDSSGNIVLQKGDVITPLVLDTLDREGRLEQIKPKPEMPVETEVGAVHVVLEKPEEHSQHKTRTHI